MISYDNDDQLSVSLNSEMPMSNLHFYKAHSRLGMINIPINGTELNIGVEDGPDAVLSDNFLQNFKGGQVTDFTFTLPEHVEPSDYQRLVAEESGQFAELINKTLLGNETQVVIGGDHSIAFATLLATLKRVGPHKVGYIQIDSHGDVHMFKTSPTGNFHGMWLRPFIGDFDSREIAKAADLKLRPGQVLFIGNLELEPEERRFFAKNKITQLSGDDLASGRTKALATIRDFAGRFEHLHIGFDIDVFHKDFASATGIPAQAGLLPDDIFEILDVLKNASSLSVDLVEVNPRKDKADATIAMAQKVLLALFG